MIGSSRVTRVTISEGILLRSEVLCLFSLWTAVFNSSSVTSAISSSSSSCSVIYISHPSFGNRALMSFLNSGGIFKDFILPLTILYALPQASDSTNWHNFSQVTVLLLAIITFSNLLTSLNCASIILSSPRLCLLILGLRLLSFLHSPLCAAISSAHQYLPLLPASSLLSPVSLSLCGLGAVLFWFLFQLFL